MATMQQDLADLQAAMQRIDTATSAIAAKQADYLAQLAALRANLPSPADQALLDEIAAGITADATALELIGKPDHTA